MEIKRGADMGIKRGADMGIKRGADLGIKRGYGDKTRIRRVYKMRKKYTNKKKKDTKQLPLSPNKI